MLCHFITFIVASLLCNVAATPYFVPWLETRQYGNPTPTETADLIYPPNNDQSTCPVVSELFNGFSLAATSSKRRRSLYKKWRPPDPRASRFRRRTLVNGTCSSIAAFTFKDWEQSYSANTATIMLEHGHTYTFSIATNVEVKKVEAWASNGKKFNSLGHTEPNAKNTTLVTSIKGDSDVGVHWKIDFRFGHPNGQVVVFSDKPPPGSTGPVTISKKYKRATLQAR